MDPIQNPFSPGAGSPPPEMVGRDALLTRTHILLARIAQKRAEKSLILTGLRGVGKTVLLNAMEREAIKLGYKTIFIEAHEHKALSALLIPQLKQLFFNLGMMTQMGYKVKRGLSVLKSFITGIKLKVGEIEFGLDIEPEYGSADSGDIEIDLPNVLVALAEAAEEKGVCIAIFIDEIQYLALDELSALIMAMHKMQQKQLPLVLVAAGLPILPALAGESKSYAERLFDFPAMGPLSESESFKALQDPVNQEGVSFTPEALYEIYRLTEGYPYFLQEWGYQAWNHAASPTISLAVVQEATVDVIRRLDDNFFKVRFDRLTPSEKNYLYAMALLSSGKLRSSDIAAQLNMHISTVGPTRAKLIKKGMIYSPVHGETAFSVPLFGDFLRRTMHNNDFVDS